MVSREPDTEIIYERLRSWSEEDGSNEEAASERSCEDHDARPKTAFWRVPGGNGNLMKRKAMYIKKIKVPALCHLPIVADIEA